MNYKKNLIIYLIISIILIVSAVCFQIFAPERVSVLIVSILIGAATGIVATMIACLLDNNHKLQEGILLFERAACYMLGELYKIANLDPKQDMTEEVNTRAMAMLDYYEALKQTSKKIDMLFIIRIRELKLIYKQLENICLYIMYDFKPLRTIKENSPENYEEIALFEALKLIEFARKFNPQPILKIIQKSKNNIPTNIFGREEFFNIIFERDIFNEEMKNRGDEHMAQEIESLCDLYKKYDIITVINNVDKVPIENWTFSTKINRKEERKINKILENNEDDR